MRIAGRRRYDTKRVVVVVVWGCAGGVRFVCSNGIVSSELAGSENTVRKEAYRPLPSRTEPI